MIDSKENNTIISFSNLGDSQNLEEIIDGIVHEVNDRLKQERK